MVNFELGEVARIKISNTGLVKREEFKGTYVIVGAIETHKRFLAQVIEPEAAIKGGRKVAILEGRRHIEFDDLPEGPIIVNRDAFFEGGAYKGLEFIDMREEALTRLKCNLEQQASVVVGPRRWMLD